MSGCQQWAGWKWEWINIILTQDNSLVRIMMNSLHNEDRSFVYFVLTDSLGYLSFWSSSMSPSSKDNFKLGFIGVFVGLVIDIPISTKRSRIFFLWLITISSFNLAISISRKYLRLARSFVANCPCKNFLSWDTLVWSSLVIAMLWT